MHDMLLNLHTSRHLCQPGLKCWATPALGQMSSNDGPMQEGVEKEGAENFRRRMHLMKAAFEAQFLKQSQWQVLPHTLPCSIHPRPTSSRGICSPVCEKHGSHAGPHDR